MALLSLALWQMKCHWQLASVACRAAAPGLARGRVHQMDPGGRPQCCQPPAGALDGARPKGAYLEVYMYIGNRAE